MSRLAEPPPQLVVDASVATKWHLRDELHTDPADSVLTAYREGRIELIAPGHIRYEVPSAIRNALRNRRLTVEQARSAISQFLGWNIPTVGDDDLILAAYEHGLRFGCSLYDGLYLALAEAARCPLVFADRRLRNAIGDRFPAAIWLEDWTA